MIELHLRPLAGDPPIPLYHRPLESEANRFARLVNKVWWGFPGAVRHAILEHWKCLHGGPAFGLVRSAPERGLSLPGSGLLVFDADRVRRCTDRSVRAMIALEVKREYRNAVAAGRYTGDFRSPRPAWMYEENGIDASGAPWGFKWARKRRRVDRFSGCIQRLLAEAERERGQPNSGCRPHKTGPFVGTNTGYDPGKHNSNCSLSGRPSRDKSGGSRKAKRRTSDRSSAGAAGSADQTSAPAEQRRQKSIDVAYIRKQMSRLQSVNASDPEAVAKALRGVIGRAKKEKAGKTVTLEAAVAALFGARLKSLETGFDAEGTVAGFPVLLDAKYSSSVFGYQESARNKGHKILEYKATGSIPLYVAMVPRKGLYLHVGIDPETSPAFEGEKGGSTKRGLVGPEDLAAFVDGSGKPLPFVQLSSRFKSLKSMIRATPADVAATHDVVARTLKGLERKMKKLHQHIDAQAKRGSIKSVVPFIEAYPEPIVRLALKKMGLSQEQIEAVIKMGNKKPSRDPKD
jgi:hypothetical protein